MELVKKLNIELNKKGLTIEQYRKNLPEEFKIHLDSLLKNKRAFFSKKFMRYFEKDFNLGRESLRKDIISSRILYCCRKTEKKNEEIAKELNIIENTFLQYLSGRRTPSPFLLTEFSLYFSVSVDFLSGMSDEETVLNEESDFINSEKYDICDASKEKLTKEEEKKYCTEIIKKLKKMEGPAKGAFIDSLKNGFDRFII